MRRALPLATSALLVAVACAAPEPPEASSTPAPVTPAADAQLTVHILVPETPDPAVEAWAQALAAAIHSGHGGLTLAATPDEAGAVVRIDAVETGAQVNPEPEGEGEVTVLQGSLVMGESARAFNLTYRGDARPQAEALARNLRRFAAEGGTGPAAAAPGEPGATEAETEDQG